MRIRVDPFILRQNSGSISGIGGNLNNVGQAVFGIAQGAPSNYGDFRAQVQAIGHEALARAQGLFSQVNDFSSQLQSRAHKFEAADMVGIAGFQNIFNNNTQILAPWLKLTGVPMDIINRYLMLGRFFGGTSFYGLLLTLLMGNNLFSRSSQPIIGIEKPGDLIELRKSLDVPFVSQWKGTNGGNNCGPASVTMAINYYGKNVKYSDVVVKMRGQNNPSGFTNFQTPEVDQLLGSYLKRVELNRSDFESQLSKNPVIIYVDTNKWQSVPYADVGNTQGPHIVVATGFEKDDSGNLIAILVNDPLAIKWDSLKKQYVRDDVIGLNFRVPIDDFNASTAELWKASAIVPKE